MSRIRAKNTQPEIKVRSALHRLGFRFRIHRKDLPGRPDVVLPKHKKIVFIHGCFWHNHDCKRGTRPKSNTAFWDEKITRNRVRDIQNLATLRASGWKVLVIWECEIRDDEKMVQLLSKFMQERKKPDRSRKKK